MVNRLNAKLSILAILLITATGLTAGSPADLTIFPKESSTRINSFTSYEVDVTNQGPVKDRYFMSSQSNEVTIAPRDFYLDSGETRTVNVWYNPETTKEEGTYSFDITARSSATGDRYTTEGIVNVIKDHQVTVEVQNSKTVCLGESATYQVEVTNTGIQKETFSLTTNYGKLSTEEVTLAEGETQVVTITASSETPVTENFNVRAASTTSYAQDIQNVQFNAETCYDSDVVINPGSQEVAAGTTAEYTINIRNLGTRADTFVLSSSQGQLSRSEIQLASGNNEEVTLQVTPQTLGTQQVTVTASSQVETTATANMEVYNGNDVTVDFTETPQRVCEAGTYNYTATVENTGEAADTYRLSSAFGNVSDSEVELEPGASEDVTVTFNSGQFEEDSRQNLTLTAQSQTFDQPRTTTSNSFTVQNCWDINMEVVPKVQSAGENRSVVYEISLENPGTVENTYQLSYEGPEWVSIKPEELTVASGATENAYIYAGIPFQKQGQVEITARAEGNQASASKTVQLVIGQEVEEAIEDEAGGSITGSFAKSASDLFNRVRDSSSVLKIAGSIIVGLIITALILVREW